MASVSILLRVYNSVHCGDGSRVKIGLLNLGVLSKDVISRLDSNNGILFGLLDKTLSPLQRAQNMAARMV
jgi:hypothetical protein